jgi:hypothetical protein
MRVWRMRTGIPIKVLPADQRHGRVTMKPRCPRPPSNFRHLPEFQNQSPRADPQSPQCAILSAMPIRTVSDFIAQRWTVSIHLSSPSSTWLPHSSPTTQQPEQNRSADLTEMNSAIARPPRKENGRSNRRPFLSRCRPLDATSYCIHGRPPSPPSPGDSAAQDFG